MLEQKEVTVKWIAQVPSDIKDRYCNQGDDMKAAKAAARP
jgi:hypothetical protein